MNKQFAISRLEEEMVNFKENGNTELEGVRTIKYILAELENDFCTEITILHNHQFELVYVKGENKIEFRTTFSNQEITQSYMNTMLYVYQRKEIISSAIQSVIYFSQK